ncbi:two-component sensor histidine kinase [Gandjariella thermophila]|uniref:histidine kinase n=1 Tax=Gandjariella thermophila TaxID=1931992 RepID=A0A4D4JEG9_9PSEU|nr:two-component sensor histidine kinase [Gandjariella thermophila]
MRRLLHLGAMMNLRTRFALAFAGVAAAAIAVVVALSYQTTANVLQVNADESFNDTVKDLVGEAQAGVLSPASFLLPGGDESVRYRLPRTPLVASQVLNPDGTVALREHPAGGLPVTAQDRALAASPAAGQLQGRLVVVEGDQYRLVTVALGGGRGAVQLAQRLTETRQLLADLGRRLIVAGLGVFVAAGLVGWVVAGRVTRRLVRLTDTAENVASTGRLDTPVPVRGRDEVGRLAAAFDSMLGQLARVKDDQRHLVQDAGHELRTPLTSLRTNVAVLRRFEELSPEARQRLLDDLGTETRELTHLVNELVELATEQHDQEAPQRVALAALAERVASRARRRTGREILVDADADAVVHGRAAALERAMSNLVENAAKFDPGGTAPIELAVSADRVVVRDRGPGIAAEDAARLFDRFYRATAARSLPGSGLGLAIVREVALSHGGTVFAENRSGGGAAIGFTLNGRTPGV